MASMDTTANLPVRTREGDAWVIDTGAGDALTVVVCNTGRDSITVWPATPVADGVIETAVVERNAVLGTRSAVWFRRPVRIPAHLLSRWLGHALTDGQMADCTQSSRFFSAPADVEYGAGFDSYLQDLADHWPGDPALDSFEDYTGLWAGLAPLVTPGLGVRGWVTLCATAVLAYPVVLGLLMLLDLLCPSH